jgi:hypothetical protein
MWVQSLSEKLDHQGSEHGQQFVQNTAACMSHVLSEWADAYYVICDSAGETIEQDES